MPGPVTCCMLAAGPAPATVTAGPAARSRPAVSGRPAWPAVPLVNGKHARHVERETC